MNTLRITTMALALLSATDLALADDMNSMNMKDMSMSMSMSGPRADKMTGKVHHATGIVKKMDASAGQITISHGPINSIPWPPMTMTFAVKDKQMLRQVTAEEKIDFDLVQSGKDQYTVTKISPAHD